MPKAISNTSPLLYLYRAGVLGWLPELFSETWIPNAVVHELEEGRLNNIPRSQHDYPRGIQQLVSNI